MSTDFEAEWRARLIAMLVPDSAPLAAKVDVDLPISGYTEYAGEPDEGTAVELRAAVTGYDETGRSLWRYARDYEGFGAAMALLSDLGEQRIR